jgi:hypothetical protein
MSAQDRETTRQERLELDIDLRLSGLWREVQGVTEWSLEAAAAYMRAAYARGYITALTEPDDARGALCRDNGYRVPEKGEHVR